MSLLAFPQAGEVVVLLLFAVSCPRPVTTLHFNSAVVVSLLIALVKEQVRPMGEHDDLLCARQYNMCQQVFMSSHALLVDFCSLA